MLQYLKMRFGPLHRDQEGATAVEYGIMVALIAVVIIAAVFFLGSELRELFGGVGSDIEGASDGVSPFSPAGE